MLQPDICNDNEQTIKFNEIVDLLVAAGYFRARIKGLSNFDKVIGGITWCIESCNFDVNVNFLFHENLSIGQKIALTEKIVCKLLEMSCPFYNRTSSSSRIRLYTYISCHSVACKKINRDKKRIRWFCTALISPSIL
ncbi:hypothetical protein KQX54_012697 [Cotesia glomerata]|uniref:CCDC93 N-terminal domain-containing protein n=1 Tax=Cotesia glomerata TaxID=32391 RepID=A0AAV7IPJ1_COTGL|nr:hypothetical protein KQX54_012697 [Cotesia glomerata]